MDALLCAVDLAGIRNDYHIIEHPRQLSFEEQIEELFVGASLPSNPSGNSYSHADGGSS